MPRALVVDDDPQIQAIMKRLLTRHGFEVEQATDIDTGFKILTKPFSAGQFRYIFLDHDMPSGDGTALAHDIVGYKKFAGGQWYPASSATFVVHSSNPDGAQRMAQILRAAHLRTRVIPKDRLVSILMFYRPQTQTQTQTKT